jgi:hypothetical protein
MVDAVRLACSPDGQVSYGGDDGELNLKILIKLVVEVVVGCVFVWCFWTLICKVRSVVETVSILCRCLVWYLVCELVSRLVEGRFGGTSEGGTYLFCTLAAGWSLWVSREAAKCSAAPCQILRLFVTLGEQLDSGEIAVFKLVFKLVSAFICNIELFFKQITRGTETVPLDR